MSEIAKSIDDIIKRDLAIRLKEAGYRKAGRTFYRQMADHTLVVNVQADKWNQGNEGRFTINLGVYFPEVARLVDAIPFTGGFPKEYDCTVQERLPALAHEGRDVWWSIDANTDHLKCASEVGATWSTFGAPWLEIVSTFQGAHAVLLSNYCYLPAAALSLILSRRDEAAEIIQKALERLPRAKQRLTAFAQKHDLLQNAV